MPLDDYYHTKFIKPGTSLYYSLRFIDKAHAAILIPLYTLLYEIAQVTTQVKEPSIAQIKLAWWKNEVDQLFNACPTHPLTKTLLPLLIQYPLPHVLFTEYIDGQALKLDVTYCETEKDFELFAYRNQGIPAVLTTWVTLPNTPQAITFANEMGIILEIYNQIKHLRQHTIQHRIYFPQTHLHSHGLSHKDFYPQVMTPAIQKFLGSQTESARARLNAALKNLSKEQKLTQRHLITLISLKLATLTLIENSGFPVFTEQTQLTALRKLWLSWKAHASLH